MIGRSFVVVFLLYIGTHFVKAQLQLNICPVQGELVKHLFTGKDLTFTFNVPFNFRSQSYNPARLSVKPMLSLLRGWCVLPATRGTSFVQHVSRATLYRIRHMRSVNVQPSVLHLLSRPSQLVL